jgi:hypothetical protein
LDPTDVVDAVRENGEGMAVDRLNGFAEDDETGGEGFGTFVCRGGKDGGCTETGRPPGVRARAMDGTGVRVSRLPVGVAVLRLCGNSSMGVGDFEVEYIESTDDPATCDVRDGNRVEDSVLSPEGVSSAAAWRSAHNRIAKDHLPFRPAHSVHPQSPLPTPFRSSSRILQMVHEAHPFQVRSHPPPGLTLRLLSDPIL